MARFWLHCHHLIVEGRKMSKSRGNIVYTDTVLDQGYSADELRFFLIYGHYRKKLNYSKGSLDAAVRKLRHFKRKLKEIDTRRNQETMDAKAGKEVKDLFTGRMDDDLDVKGAFDRLNDFFTKTDLHHLKPNVASGYLKTLREIDTVLKVLF